MIAYVKIQYLLFETIISVIHYDFVYDKFKMNNGLSLATLLIKKILKKLYSVHEFEILLYALANQE